LQRRWNNFLLSSEERAGVRTVVQLNIQHSTFNIEQPTTTNANGNADVAPESNGQAHRRKGAKSARDEGIFLKKADMLKC